MPYLTAWHTDAGTKKKVNQDSLLILQARHAGSEVLLAACCDGVGGLARGELASAAAVLIMAEWFHRELPDLLAQGFSETGLQGQWRELIERTNRRIAGYTKNEHTGMGTTAAVLLLYRGRYYLMNIGDSRIYRITDRAEQLTKDQTYVQREIDEGRMTEQQAMADPNRGILLQCIGTSGEVLPEFASGSFFPGDLFLLCCDGFRHVVTPDEFYRMLYPPEMITREVMTDRLKELTALNIARREEDNISAIAIRTV